MSKKMKFDSSKNPAINFSYLIKKLEKISKESNTQMSDVISKFMIDLKNYYNEDYNKMLDINLRGNVTPTLLNSLNSYLAKLLKEYKKQENGKTKKKLNDKKRIIEKQQMADKWAETEKSISGDITDPEVASKIIDDLEKNSSISRNERKFIIIKFNEKRAKFIQAWNEIENMVQKLASENTNRTKLEYWEAVKDLIGNGNVNIKMDEEMKKQMISKIDENILSEKDNLYYEQVKYFTNDFSFLKDYVEVQEAIKGHRKRKFTDMESFNRYYNLTALLREEEGYSEYSQIDKLLKSKKISEIDRRILTERRAVISKEEEMAR